MSLYSKAVYPELSYRERQNDTLNARTYDALIQVLRLRDLSEGEIPAKIADQDQQRSMNWFMSE
jgi:hypothetical protein|tara:strand:- start:533 stop:724 length:192 start_codon:yes stop_codon:yes gene_type:complete